MRHMLPVTAMTIALFGTSWAASDKSFIKDAIKGNNSEIALGQLATEKGGSQTVKDFGQMLVTDHKQSKADAEQVAAKLGVASTDEMTGAAKKEQKKLAKLSGTKFDQEFARHMVKDHKNDIKEFAKASKGTGDVAEYAAKTLPTLQKHLETAEKLSK